MSDDLVDQRRRVGAGDDARPQDVGLDLGAGDELVEQALQLGLLGRVVEALGPARLDVLGQRLGVVGMEAVGGDRRGVDEPRRRRRRAPPRRRCATREVDLARLLVVSEDDEGEVDDDVGALDQGVHRLAVEHVALAVLGPLPAEVGGVEGAARHADDAPDLGRLLERAHGGAADVTGRAGDRDGEAVCSRRV